jgi:hypothetical protein
MNRLLPVMLRGLNYLATPYTDYQPSRDQAHEDACALAGRLMRTGIEVFSPIAHSHWVAVHGRIDQRDRQFWMKRCAPMMRVCDALIVGQLVGWEDSIGVLGELTYFRGAGKPVFFCNPTTLQLSMS